jgi:archaellum component FlaC
MFWLYAIRFVLKLLAVCIVDYSKILSPEFSIPFLLISSFEILFSRRLYSQRENIYLIAITSFLIYLVAIYSKTPLYLLTMFLFIDISSGVSVFLRWVIFLPLIFVVATFSLNIPVLFVSRSVNPDKDLPENFKVIKGNAIDRYTGKKESVNFSGGFLVGNYLFSATSPEGDEFFVFLRTIDSEKEILFFSFLIILSLIFVLLVLRTEKKDLTQDSQSVDKTKTDRNIFGEEGLLSGDKTELFSLYKKYLEEAISNLKANIEEDKAYLSSITKTLDDFKFKISSMLLEKSSETDVRSLVRNFKSSIYDKVQQISKKIDELRRIIDTSAFERIQILSYDAYLSLITLKDSISSLREILLHKFRSMEYVFHEIYSPLGGIENDIGKIRFFNIQKIFDFSDIEETFQDFCEMIVRFKSNISAILDSIKILAFNSFVIAYKIKDKVESFEVLSSAIEMIMVNVESFYSEVQELWNVVEENLAKIRFENPNISFDELEKQISEAKKILDEGMQGIRSFVSSLVQFTNTFLNNLSSGIEDTGEGTNFFSKINIKFELLKDSFDLLQGEIYLLKDFAEEKSEGVKEG